MYRFLLILNTVLFALIFSSGSSFSGQAQDTDDICPEIVETALAQVDEFCQSLGRNEICYGNVQIDATDFQQLPVESFANQGDVVGVTDIATVSTAPLNVANQTWGVAVMALQANLPDTLPGQNVTFLLFGDVTLENEVITDTTASDYSAPMQAFRFNSGVGQATCEEVPQSGLVIQSPQDTRVNFRVNGLDLEIGSLVVLQTTEDGFMRIAVLEGQVTATQDGETVVIVAGQEILVPISDEERDVLPEPMSAGLGLSLPETSLFDLTFASFTLSGGVQWLDTGLTFENGESFLASATGEITLWPQCYELCGADFCEQLCPALTTSPAGSVPISGIVPDSAPFMQSPEAPLGALLGRIGESGTPFVMSALNTVEGSGTLYLGLNEDTRFYGDETGAYNVNIISLQGE